MSMQEILDSIGKNITSLFTRVRNVEESVGKLAEQLASVKAWIAEVDIRTERVSPPSSPPKVSSHTLLPNPPNPPTQSTEEPPKRNEAPTYDPGEGNLSPNPSAEDKAEGGTYPPSAPSPSGTEGAKVMPPSPESGVAAGRPPGPLGAAEATDEMVKGLARKKSAFRGYGNLENKKTVESRARRLDLQRAYSKGEVALPLKPKKATGLKSMLSLNPKKPAK